MSCKRKNEDNGDDSGLGVVSPNTMELNIKRQRILEDDNKDNNDSENNDSGLESGSPNTIEIDIERQRRLEDNDDNKDDSEDNDSGLESGSPSTIEIDIERQRRLEDNGDSGDDDDSGLEVVSSNTMEIDIECDDLFNSKMRPELVIKIFSYLRYKDLLSAAALVCKRWDAYTRVPELWRRINLRYKLDTTTETVEKLLKRSKGIKYIDLTMCKLIKESVIFEIANLKMLRTLILARCNQLSPVTICSIANCRTLEHLDLSHLPLNDDALGLIAESCTNLIRLDVNYCTDITTQGLLPVIQHCVQLKDLQLSACVEVDDEFLIALTEKPSQIECLFIAECNFTAEGLKYLRKMPKLMSISASAVNSMCDNLVSTFSNLTFLSLARLEDITVNGISVIVRNNPNLTTFILSDCKSIDDKALEIISKSPCRSILWNLVVSRCPVSEIGISLILQNCAKLRYLIFTDIAEESMNKWQIEYPHIRFSLGYQKIKQPVAGTVEPAVVA